MEEGRRPGVFVVGSSGVGKRTLLSRLISVDFEDSPSQTEEVHDWTINTKYYTADVSVSISHIRDDEDYSLPRSHPLVALVMVFDLSQVSTLVALQDWVSNHAEDIDHFDILLCIGNKVDLFPHHPAHDEYRRRISKATDEDEFVGISESEGSRLLGNGHDSTSLDIIRGTCLDWCRDNNIEFIEACASNPDFDKCLSVDGDCQGVERLFGALSAHMWPGMILKSGGDKINEPVLLPHGEEDLSEEESEYELEYEVLSSDPWEDIDERWVSAGSYADDAGGSTSRETLEVENNILNPKKVVDESSVIQTSETDRAVDEKPLGKLYELEDVKQLMSEIGNIRDNLRFMPDFQRRDIAANLAMKMASMFGGGDESDNEENLVLSFNQNSFHAL
ncbi:unnamed protein product [Eruca vesicaria subsp. sativa]|uniref:Uncharacterized protein n=1 Tax=Eruca vesicaria subsp. sativa TaxID=29727 RepID=A0ABC8JAM3_ERUVS|nr:unnamed protein product [Eruca vesicaria subsp. sativa]